MSYPDYDTPGLHGVLAEIHAERARQDAKWGPQNHPDGTGDAAMLGMSMASIAQMLKGINGDLRATGLPVWLAFDNQRSLVGTGPKWLPIFLEEVSEAAAEDEPAKLRAELIQVAAVAVAWIEAIDRRGGAR